MGTIKSKMSDTPKIKRKNRLLDFRSESDPGPTRAETDDAFQEQTERNPVCNSLKTTGQTEKNGFMNRKQAKKEERIIRGHAMREASNKRASGKRVRAICDHEESAEFNIKMGDILEIAADYSQDARCYFLRNKKSSKTGYVPVNKVRKIIDDIEALEGFCEVDRETAEECLKEKGSEPGVYLIRPSYDDGDYALSVICENEDKGLRIRHCDIKAADDGNYYISVMDTKPFTSITGLIDLFSDKPVLGINLIKPYSGYLTSLKELAIDMNDLTIGKKLGNGHFATIYEGMLYNSQTVAAKSLKPGGSLSMTDFLKEAYVMHKLRHDRLVRLIGFCINRESSVYSVYVVMEKMSKGALKDLLLKDQGKEIKFSHLMTMAKQVAEGMSYLESKNFVHRDLRAANILVDDSYDVKIADFGLARFLDQYYKHVHFYKETKGAAFPFKWTAPEAVKKLEFTLKSDVWSFGILLYEIVTYGEEFYLGMNNHEAVEWVVKGNRLEKPNGHHCPDNLYKLMTICWNEEPTERPTFKTINETLHEINDEFNS